MKKRIAYDYLFNYSGGDTHKGRTVTGAGITLSIRAYKDGKEVLFEDGAEPKAKGRCLSDIYKVSFDRKKQFIIKKNLYVDNLFRLVYGWDRIRTEAIGYSLDAACGLAKDCEGIVLPFEFQKLPVSELAAVSERKFKTFLKSHEDDFDITDNKPAQVSSAMFYDVPERTRAAYEYLTNHFCKDIQDGKIISGINISVNIRGYKNNKEILLEKDVFDIYKMSFMGGKQFVIEKDIPVDDITSFEHDCDYVKTEVIACLLDDIHVDPDIPRDSLSGYLKEIPIYKPRIISEQTFRKFLEHNAVKKGFCYC